MYTVSCAVLLESSYVFLQDSSTVLLFYKNMARYTAYTIVSGRDPKYRLLIDTYD